MDRCNRVAKAYRQLIIDNRHVVGSGIRTLETICFIFENLTLQLRNRL